jgi:hypothetical protein
MQAVISWKETEEKKDSKTRYPELKKLKKKYFEIQWRTSYSSGMTILNNIPIVTFNIFNLAQHEEH